jgi:hypothetical protein
MSGQPYRYVKDVENFRNEYMDALNLRANIDDMNYQANKNYLETGALPPRSTMKDMRSTAEILMDVEKLKINIIGEFKGVATPQMIQLVIQRVQASPLNGDGSFLVWLAQNARELVPQLKKKYAYGIAGDANDAENMYLFMADIFSKTKDINSTLKSAFDRPVGSDGIGINVGDFVKLKKAYDEISLRLVSSPSLTPLKTKIRDQFNAMDNFINGPAPPAGLAAAASGTSKYDQLKDIFNNISKNATASQQNAINQTGYKGLLDYTDKLPSPSQLRTVLEQLKKSDANASPDLSIKILENLTSILPSVEESNKINALATQIIQSNGTAGYFRPPVPAAAAPTAGAQAQSRNQSQVTIDFLTAVAAMLSTSSTNVTSPPVGTNVPHQEFEDWIRNEVDTLEGQFESLYPNFKSIIGYDRSVLDSRIKAATANYNWFFMDGGNIAAGGIGLQRNITPMQLRVGIRNNRPNDQVFIGAGIGKRAGRPRGSGIVKSLNERIDNTQGIKQGHTHVPFGKYIINKNRLDDDIFSFKHIKGYGVKGYPSKKISKNLSNVIKTIIGGGVPKYNELSNLSNDEKEYLHTVSSKAGIMDKISVPTPSKDSMEQDVHQFNVMKGEILAGNDSSVLIKKFKLLLLKLSKNGSLPKRECQEIMEDLIQLGY